jgi:hypothetical protein
MWVFFFSIFLLSPLIAQEEKTDMEPAEEPRKVCVFDVPQIQKDKKESGGEIFTEVIKSTLIFELNLAGFTIIDDGVWKEIRDIKGYSDEDLLEGSNAVAVARQVKADVAIAGFVQVDQRRILFGIKCYDVKSRRLAVSILKDGRAGVSATSLINDAVEEIIPKISEELTAYSTQGETIEKEVIVYEDIPIKEMIEMGSKIQVTLKSVDEDTDIYLADKFIGKIKEGEISFESKASSVVEVRMEKSSYHPRTCEFELGAEDEVINLPRLEKVHRLAVYGEYTLFQTIGMGIGLRYYFVPNFLFISFTNYTYLQAGYLPGSNSVLHFDNNFSVGYYLYFSPSSFFRAGILTGFGWIPTVVLAPDTPVAHDFYWDILGGWVELNFKHFILYYKLTGRFNHDITGKGLLDTGWAKPIPVLISIGVVWKW